jgi:dTDP-4-amino-4,6-dideoxygalactose transaminase
VPTVLYYFGHMKYAAAADQYRDRVKSAIDGGDSPQSVVTNDAEMDRKLRLLRNHGLRNRDEMEIFGYNSRLDSFQAVVGKWMLRQIHDLVDKRIAAANYYDEGFSDLLGVRIPPIADGVKHVYLLYILFADNRDALLEHCVKNGIEAKIHYPIPLYQQEALKPLGIPPGTFPVTDGHSRNCITFPVDQHLSREEQDFLINTVRDFYKGAGA